MGRCLRARADLGRGPRRAAVVHARAGRDDPRGIRCPRADARADDGAGGRVPHPACRQPGDRDARGARAARRAAAARAAPRAGARVEARSECRQRRRVWRQGGLHEAVQRVGRANRSACLRFPRRRRRRRARRHGDGGGARPPVRALPRGWEARSRVSRVARLRARVARRRGARQRGPPRPPPPRVPALPAPRRRLDRRRRRCRAIDGRAASGRARRPRAAAIKRQQRCGRQWRGRRGRRRAHGGGGGGRWACRAGGAARALFRLGPEPPEECACDHRPGGQRSERSRRRRLQWQQRPTPDSADALVRPPASPPATAPASATTAPMARPPPAVPATPAPAPAPAPAAFCRRRTYASADCRWGKAAAHLVVAAQAGS